MGAPLLAPDSPRTASPARLAGPVSDLRSRAIAAYRDVCALELAALKPGNVHRHADGHGMTVADFLRSAEVSAGPLTEPGLGLGSRIYRAVAATRAAVGCNTNLGILLLSAPLIQATLDERSPGTLRERLARVLAAADRADTDSLFRAIRLAAPGGLGRSDAHDVCTTPEASLLEVMSHAALRDRIALQYATVFADLFDRAVPLLAGLERRWRSPAWAAAGLYMDFLSRFPDTHVARKLGEESAWAVCRQAGPLANSLLHAKRPQPLRGALLALDRRLKEAGTNPGTSADLTVACLLIRRLAPLCGSLGISSHSTADRRRASDPGPDAPAPGFHERQTET
jgi:triphosphoribosyl-dephospho-CoA synthase